MKLVMEEENLLLDSEPFRALYMNIQSLFVDLYTCCCRCAKFGVHYSNRFLCICFPVSIPYSVVLFS